MLVRVLLAAALAVAVPDCRPVARPPTAENGYQAFGPGVLSVGLVNADAHALRPPPPNTEIRYIANAGVLVRVEGRKFLVDAPFRDGISPYAVSSADERSRLEGARDPYGDVDAILVTHWHEDHFDADAVAAHLSRNARAVLISSTEVVERVRRQAPGLSDARFRALVPPPGGSERISVGGVPVHVLRVRHNPTRRLPGQHVAFLLGERSPVLHVGDADPAADNFARLASMPAVDVAILPFWYLTDPTSRSMVAAAIRPRHVVVVHVPPRDARDVERKLRDAGVTVSVPSQTGPVPDPFTGAASVPRRDH